MLFCNKKNRFLNTFKVCYSFWQVPTHCSERNSAKSMIPTIIPKIRCGRRDLNPGNGIGSPAYYQAILRPHKIETFCAYIKIVFSYSYKVRATTTWASSGFSSTENSESILFLVESKNSPFGNPPMTRHVSSVHIFATYS